MRRRRSTRRRMLGGNQEQAAAPPKKTVVLYTFHEYNDRVGHFIKHAIFEDSNVDFVVICCNPTLEFECPPYVKKIMRENKGFDFGAWSDTLLLHGYDKGYENYIFANSSTKGPYLRPDFKGKWTDVYINGLTGNVKLFGSTISTIKSPKEHSHVQSYIYAMKKDTLDYLIQRGIFSKTDYAKTMDDAIWKKEVAMSRYIIEKGWNIGSLLPLYKDVDFTFSTPQDEEKLKKYGDIMTPAGHNNKLWNEYDLVFIKGNRGFHI